MNHDTTKRSDWPAGVWEGRAQTTEDADGNVVRAAKHMLTDEGGNLEEFQEITGAELACADPGEASGDTASYHEDWSTISRSIKAARGWCCELCGFSSHGSAALHAHHIDHDKADNSPANLQVLCLACHKAKHGGGSGMGEGVSKAELQEMDEYHRSPQSRARLRDEPMID